MSKKLRALLERKQKLVGQASAITDAAAAASRDLTDEERTQSDGLLAQLGTLNQDIERQRQVDAAEASLAGLPVSGAAGVGNPAPVVEQDPRRGFQSFGQFCADVRRAGTPGASLPERLAIAAAAPSTYGSEGVGADGGFLVPPAFSAEIYRHAIEQDPILPRTDGVPVGGNSMTFPKDETTPWGSDGVRAYWEAEAAAATATKPKFGTTTLRLHKLFGLVPVTDELLADASALEAFIFAALAASIGWKFNDAFYNGTGAGQPLGILNAGAAVSVAKESGQAAATLKVENVAKMFARMPASSLSRAVWMINNDVLPQLITMVLNNYPIYVPAGGLPNAPAGTLLGRPIVLSQHCKTLGTKGDIALVDWKAYRTITKGAGVIETATSMHLYFDAGATAFRSTFRIDGQPKFSSSITPANGSGALSPFVFLDTRS